MKLLSLICGVALLSSACTETSNTRPASAEPAATAAPSGAGSSGKSAPASAVAAVGVAAPEFTLKDLDGKDVSLASFKGKTVVLEWFNPGCPFVKSSHGKGSLKGFSEKAMKGGVVWLAINSGAPGKQGHGVEANREGAKTFGVTNPILMDESGTVGKAYGATNTPQIVIVDAKGTVVYKGAVDNSPDGEGESPQPEGAKLVNYVEQALAEIAEGKPVSVPSTKPYGCSVKYGS
jgi:peroxiredoxin